MPGNDGQPAGERGFLESRGRAVFALELALEEFLREIRSCQFGDGFFAGNVIAFDRAFGQTLFEFGIGAGKLGEGFFAGHVVAFDRALGQALLEFGVGAQELGKRFFARDVVAFDRARSQTPFDLRVRNVRKRPRLFTQKGWSGPRHHRDIATPPSSTLFDDEPRRASNVCGDGDRAPPEAVGPHRLGGRGCIRSGRRYIRPATSRHSIGNSCSLIRSGKLISTPSGNP